VAVRREIGELRSSGMSLRRIAEKLNERQVPTAQGGVCWHASTVRAVLLSP